VPENSGGGATAAAADPLLVQRFQEVETLHYIQVVDVTAGHRIVTSLEFLSLANKSTKPGRQQYRGKQRKMLDGRVNLVEIVLLNLQTLIDAAYVNGRYADDLDYSKPPRPQLTGPDAEWAERVLREQGLRQGG
jgi:hypothetical protein